MMLGEGLMAGGGSEWRYCGIGIDCAGGFGAVMMMMIVRPLLYLLYVYSNATNTTTTKLVFISCYVMLTNVLIACFLFQ